ncbi:MAG TPA: SPOR domain-containing protein [Dongiaceae bacterium]|jgi:hypothetical protein
MSSEKPDQIQASVAAALSRLRGDLGPSGATAPKVDAPQGEREREMARPANDVRADPFFRSIQAPPGSPSRGPIPMTPFARMQAPQEPAPSEPAAAELPEEAASEPTTTIEIPPMPVRSQVPEPVAMPEPVATPQPAASAMPAPQPAPAAAASQPAPAAPNSPLSRMMRGTTPELAKKDPAQRDLLANLPPPPISEPLSEDTDSAMRRRRRNRRLLALVGVVIIAALGAWLWTGKEKSTEVPVIAADSTPEKVKPADEGGLQVPNQNVQVLENMSGQPAQQQGETVMPEPEQPVTPPAASSEQQANTEQAPTVVEKTAPDASGTTTSPAPAADTPPAPEAPLNTAPLPEGENATADASTATPPNPEPAPAQQPAEATQVPATTGQAPATTEQAPAQATAQPAPALAPEPAQATQQPAQPAQTQPSATQEAAITPTAPAGNTRIQLAAGKSEDAVKKQWAALQKAYPDLLGPLSLTVQKVDKGAAGIFYRLQAGPVADKAAAKKLCASLKAKGQDCIVASK